MQPTVGRIEKEKAAKAMYSRIYHMAYPYAQCALACPVYTIHSPIDRGGSKGFA